MSNELQRAEKVLQRINELAAVSEDTTCITRTYGTGAFIEGRNKVEQWMKEAGLQTWVDNIGNSRAKLPATNSHAPTLVIASHIDTVINAGKFDGPLGVLMGLDLLEHLARSKAELPFHIELVGFCDEEGCRFHTTYLGSKALTGLLDKEILGTKDAAGISLQQVIEQNGGDTSRLQEDAISKNKWLGYYEIHIEQGPVLFEKNIPVGIVTAIAGQRRVGIIFTGEAGHAGTVPMDMRRDALGCAAEFITETEKYATAHKDTLVATVGRLQITHAASNVIPGEVVCSLDLRSADETVLVSAYQAIRSMAEVISQKRKIGLEWNCVHEAKPVACDLHLRQLLDRAVQKAGYERVELASGAGHDAVPVSAVSPVAMLFVKCFKGISHNPLENVEAEDIAAAIKVSDNFIRELIASQNPSTSEGKNKLNV
jgi:allantoate deiminase